MKVISLALALFLINEAYAQNKSPSDLDQRTLERATVEAVIWAMPAVNCDLMLQEMLAKTPASMTACIGRRLARSSMTMSAKQECLGVCES